MAEIQIESDFPNPQNLELNLLPTDDQLSKEFESTNLEINDMDISLSTASIDSESSQQNSTTGTPTSPISASLWATCIIVVNFDLEYGQKLEKMVPEVSFSEDILSTICFSSLPDCTITERNTIYTFRVRRNEIEPKRYLYGYVLYRQERDSTIHRGFLQKSVAILSENNLVDFYHQVISAIGEAYFSFGEKCLETAWTHILNWPRPELSTTLSFPILGTVIKHHMPTIRNGAFIFTPHLSILETGRSKSPKPNRSSLSSNFEKNLELDERPLCTVPICGPLHGVLSKIWMIWEWVILGKPILILSPSPQLSSAAVLAVATLISPLEFKGDFRPFFTIHDPDFKAFSDDYHEDWKKYNEYISQINSKPSSSNNNTSSIELKNNNIYNGGVILGGTNAYFSKAMEHWKYVITLSGSKKYLKSSTLNDSQELDANVSSISSGNQSVGLIEYNDHVQTGKYHTVFPSPVDLKKHLKKPSSKHSVEFCHEYNEKLIRYHLHLHTTTFLAPLRAYFDRYVQSKLTQFKAFAKIPLVSELNATVLNSIRTHLQPARSLNEVQFYDNFIRTPTFKRWYDKKRKIANDKLVTEYLKFLDNHHSTLQLGKLSELELINLYQEVCEQYKRDKDILGEKGQSQLRSFMDHIVSFLEHDLQKAIQMSYK